MKYFVCLWFVFFPIISFAQLSDSEITFIKLSDGIGYIIDSIENKKCKCIPYVDKREFRYAALVQFPDSHMVVRIKRLNHVNYTDVSMTEAEVVSLHALALNINQDLSTKDTSTEQLMLNAISGDSTIYHFLNYDELKFPVNINAQNIPANTRVYKLFKVGFGIGAGVTFTKEMSGLLLTFEPAIRIKDNFAIGFRVESMAPISFEHSVPAINSYTMNLQYYFDSDEFRPFADVGLGFYDGSRTNEEFGFYPRAGFDYGHFSLSMDYNFILNQNNDLYSYLGFRIGFFLGGGKK